MEFLWNIDKCDSTINLSVKSFGDQENDVTCLQNISSLFDKIVLIFLDCLTLEIVDASEIPI